MYLTLVFKRLVPTIPRCVFYAYSVVAVVKLFAKSVGWSVVRGWARRVMAKVHGRASGLQWMANVLCWNRSGSSAKNFGRQFSSDLATCLGGTVSTLDCLPKMSPCSFRWACAGQSFPDSGEREQCTPLVTCLGTGDCSGSRCFKSCTLSLSCVPAMNSCRCTMLLQRGRSGRRFSSCPT